MSVTLALRQIGPTVALSVTASSTTSVSPSVTSNDAQVFASFVNTGTNPVAVTVSSLATAPASVLPVAGTPQTCILLPASMVMPVIYAVPTNFSVTAIGTAAGPALVYITPVAAQS